MVVDFALNPRWFCGISATHPLSFDVAVVWGSAAQDSGRNIVTTRRESRRVIGQSLGGRMGFIMATFCSVRFDEF